MHSSVFPVDEITDSFWSSAMPGRSASVSDWSCGRLLDEVYSAAAISPSSSTADCAVSVPPLASNSKPPEGDKELNRQKLDKSSMAAPIKPDDYHAFLKSQLHLACAAVAQSRGSVSKPGESSALPETQPQPIKSLQVESQGDGSGRGVSAAPCASDGASLGVPALPSVKRTSAAQVKQTTSESSREESDDDELEVDTGTTENQDPVEVRRVRRMQSNRESARRSRRRKQEHMTELESQVGQLKVEHNTLLKRFTDINHKYDEASVDNRILKADIETLRAKVKMAEETVKRVTGVNPLLFALSNMPNTSSIPFLSSSSAMDSFPIPPPMPTMHQPNPSHRYFDNSVAPGSIIPLMNPTHPSRLDNGYHNNTTTNSNPVPTAVKNIENDGVEPNNVGHISSMPNTAVEAMPEWGLIFPPTPGSISSDGIGKKK